MQRLAPQPAPRAQPSSARELDRRIAFDAGCGRERIARQRIPVRAVIGRDGEEVAQAVTRAERGLQTMARMLADEVAAVGVAQAPVGAAHRAVARDERVAELVEDQLRERVVGIEVLALRQREHALPVVCGVAPNPSAGAARPSRLAAAIQISSTGSR